MKKILLTLVVLFTFSGQSHAWTLFPGWSVGQRLASHVIAGAVTHAIADRHAPGVDGVRFATGLGVVKELTDTAFDPVGAIAWTAGALIYRHWGEPGWYTTGCVDHPQELAQLIPNYVPCAAK